MKNSNINKIFTLALLFFYNCTFIPTLVADQSPEIEAIQEQTTIPGTAEQGLADFPPELLELLQKEQATLFEKLLGSTLEQFKRFDTIAEYYAQVINNNQLQNINKKEAISHIRTLRGLFNSLKASSYVVVEPTSIKILSDLIKALIEHFKFISNNGLTILPQLDIQACITRSVSEELDLEALEKQIATNEKELANIEQQSKYLGLSLFNRAYRKTEKFISDYALINKALIGMGVGLAGYILISRLEPDWVKDVPVIGWLKTRVFGDKPRYGFKTMLDPEKVAMPTLISASPEDINTFFTQLEEYNKWHTPAELKNQLVNSKALSWIGKLEHYVGQQGLGVADLTIPTLLTVPVIANFYASDWKSLTTWFKKHLETVRGKLRGGPIERTVESWHIDPKLRFKDIVGKEHIKSELMRVINFLEDPDRYIRAGNRPETGYLLIGGPGTGKSALAEAFAGEAKDRSDKVRFYSFSAADIKAIGGIDVVVSYAKANAPCVVFIDEIDMTLWQRERDPAGTSVALTTLSGVMTKDIEHTVIIIGATNRPENMDSALYRKGRFGKRLHFENPTYDDRVTYLKQQLENRGIVTISDSYLERLAAESEHCILPDLMSVLEKALYYAKINNETLTETHIDRAFDDEVREIVNDQLTLSPDDLRLISVHEAGHALSTLLLHPSFQLVKVTILPVMAKIQEEAIWMKYLEKKSNQKIMEHGKTFKMSSTKNSLKIESYDDLVKQIKIELAGHAAEIVIYGNSSYRHHMTDRERALAIAKHLFSKGLPSDQLGEKQRENINQHAMNFLDACETEMVQLLTIHKDVLVKLADTLTQKLNMTAAEVNECIHMQK